MRRVLLMWAGDFALATSQWLARAAERWDNRFEQLEAAYNKGWEWTPERGWQRQSDLT